MTPAPDSLGTDAADNLRKLKQKLRELFQLDRGDLDFGLYRIMAHKSAEVGDFLDNHLLPQVTEALGEIAKSDTAIVQKELEQAIKGANDLGVDPETTRKVQDLRKQIAAAKNNQQVEAETYNHLYNFFARYYDEGDFMSLRRYKGPGKAAYAIPWNGEEVKLHWANADQYYIKTTENYASYVFLVGNDDKKRRVRFEIAAADAEKDNIKESNDKKRFFILSKDFLAEGDELIARFDHRPLTDGENTRHKKGAGLQERINKDAEQRILAKLKSNWKGLLAAPCPTEKDAERTLLGRHLAAYTAKNSFDYFIHKDLGGFLRRELDYYLKSEVISIDNLELTDDPAVFARNLAQVKAIKQVGGKIMDFLAQLENFQKQLWLKKKFVLDTHYCVTLDKAPESLYAEIARNKDQRDEWVKLFAIDELTDGKKLTVEFLKENPYLVLDTRHFDGEFTDKLLAALSKAGPIEEQMNGLLVHGENFQALNLLQERYRGRVKCVYIDPPYNTASSEILYKNNYKHSSWASLVYDRLMSGSSLLSEDGFNIATIDYAEFYNFGAILDNVFSRESRVGIVTVYINPKGRQHERFFSSSTEYMIFHAKNPEKANFNKTTIDESKAEKFGLKDEKGSFRLDEFARIRTSTTRKQKPDFFYPIYVSPDLSTLTLKEIKGYHEVLPTNEKGDEYSWKVIPETFEKNSKSNIYVASYNENGNLRIYNKYYEQQVYLNIWTDKKYFPEFQGTQLIKDIFGSTLFSYPKSVHAVSDSLKITASKQSFIVDYFAGSGTTGHAIINLNREDNGDRKYILVEMGEHFHNVLLPRMKKIVYSKEWRDGKPQNRQGVSQLFKYVRLESYEDTLDSLAFNGRDDLFDATANKAMIEDYQLRYALGAETAQSASLLGKDFTDPFNYTLSVVRDGARRDVAADIAETFNFLLGLRLANRRQLGGVLTITGTTAKGENCLVLWRNLNKMNANKLDKWFTAHCKEFGDDLHLIYVNGDHTLNALRKPRDKWEAITTEPVFRELMFEGAEL